MESVYREYICRRDQAGTIRLKDRGDWLTGRCLPLPATACHCLATFDPAMSALDIKGTVTQEL